MGWDKYLVKRSPPHIIYKGSKSSGNWLQSYLGAPKSLSFLEGMASTSLILKPFVAENCPGSCFPKKQQRLLDCSCALQFYTAASEMRGV